MNSRIENYFADPKTRNRRILLFAVITVLLSRALIALVHVWYVSKYGGTGWWVTDLNAWDSAWYRSIVMEGYALEPSPGRSEVNWAFFPLLPMIVRGLYQLTGMEPYIIAMLVDTLFLMGIVIVGFVYISETRHSYTQAAATGIIFTFGAYSFYFSIMYTEALYLLLLLITLYALEKKEYLIMGMAGAFLSATRNTGIMVVFAVGVKVIMNYIEEADNEKKSFAGFLKYAFGDWKLVLGICLIPAGLFAFMAYLGWKMGDPLAFVHVQVAWGGEMGNPLRVLYGGLRSGNIRLFYLGVWGIAGGFVILVACHDPPFDSHVGSFAVHAALFYRKRCFCVGRCGVPFLEKTSFSASCFYCCSCIDGISVYLDVVCKKTDYGIDVDRQSVNWALKKD